MPRIPTYQPGGGGVPVAPGSSGAPQPGRITPPRMLNYSDLAPAAMADFGLELAKSGRMLSLIAESRQKAQQTIEVMEKESGFLVDLQNLKRSLIADPTQYEAVIDRAPKEIKSLQEKHLEGVTDPDVKTALQRVFMRPSLSAEADILEWGHKRRVDRGIAALENSVDQLSRLYHQADKDEDKANLLGKIQGSIAASAAAGFINREKAGEMWRTVQQDIMEAEVMGMARFNPAQTRQKLEDPNWAPGLDPKRRERLLGTMDRKIDMMQRRAETDEAKALRLQDRAEKEAENNLKKFHEANYDRAAALQVQGKLSLADINTLRDKRDINPDGYRMLIERHGRDFEKLINEGELDIAKNFRTTGPGAAILDAGQEAYIADLQREFRNKVRKQNVDPNEAYNEIMAREKELRPVQFNAIVKPKYLDGPYQSFQTHGELKEFITRIDKAQEITSQKYQSGELDITEGKLQMQRIKDLKKWAEVEYERRLRMDTEKKKK